MDKLGLVKTKGSNFIAGNFVETPRSVWRIRKTREYFSKDEEKA
jgi:hypothetical protein